MSIETCSVKLPTAIQSEKRVLFSWSEDIDTSISGRRMVSYYAGIAYRSISIVSTVAANYFRSDISQREVQDVDGPSRFFISLAYSIS